MTINERIFEAINKKGLKQSDFAKYLEVNQSVITTWKKRGSTPPAELLVRICEFTGLSIYELLNINKHNFDEELLEAYHAAEPKEQEIICKILNINMTSRADQKDASSNLSISKIG